MAHLGALVGATLKGPPALLATRELDGRIGLPRAPHLPPLLVTEALLVHNASTGVTDIGMAQRLADVDLTVEKATTRLSTARFLLLAAAHLPGELSAGAGPAYGGTAWWALAWVTLQVAPVDAERRGTPGTAAHLSAAVRHPVPVPLGVHTLPAEAHVAVRRLEHRALAGWAPPATLFHKGSRRQGPLASTSQVEDMVAARAAPDGFGTPDAIAAHHALVLAREKQLYQPVFL